MAQEYFAINTSSKTGIFALTRGVFETITEITISEMEDIQVGDPTTFKKAIVCKLTKDKMIITADIKVKYGVNVNNKCVDLQKKIYQAVSEMCEIKPDLIDVRVTGFVF